jgi:hypothetical protein
VAVDFNKQAFLYGRRYAHRPEQVLALLPERREAVPGSTTLDALIDDRAARLVEYQDEAYAQRYRRTLERLRDRGPAPAQEDSLTAVAAKALYKLMAYKDEYEVARLYSRPGFLAKSRRISRATTSCASTWLRRCSASATRTRATCRSVSSVSGCCPPSRLLAPLRRLRGTALDVFGYTAERRRERQDISAYERSWTRCGRASRTLTTPRCASCWRCRCSCVASATSRTQPRRSSTRGAGNCWPARGRQADPVQDRRRGLKPETGHPGRIAMGVFSTGPLTITSSCFANDRRSGLRAIIAVHDTTLGPAVGGCRMYPYAGEEDAIEDVLRLSRGMTYKSALAGLPLGGGKSVIIGDPAARQVGGAVARPWVTLSMASADSTWPPRTRGSACRMCARWGGGRRIRRRRGVDGTRR